MLHVSEAELRTWARRRGRTRRSRVPGGGSVAPSPLPGLELAALPPNVSERDFQALVRKAALGADCLYFHDQDSRMNDSGLPDTVVVTPGGLLLFAELKTAKGKLSDDQAAWLRRLGAVKRIHVGLFRPSDAGALADLITDRHQ